jgi:hypothetical protein
MSDGEHERMSMRVSRSVEVRPTRARANGLPTTSKPRIYGSDLQHDDQSLPSDLPPGFNGVLCYATCFS